MMDGLCFIYGMENVDDDDVKVVTSTATVLFLPVVFLIDSYPFY